MFLTTLVNGPYRVTTIRCDQVKRIPSWKSKPPVFCSILKKISDDHQYLADPFAALADFKVILEEASKQTHQELPAQHSTLVHCCEAWELVGKCFDQYCFECVDSHGLSQTSLTRERIAERESEIRGLPWSDGKGQRLGEMQTRSSRVAYQEADALSPRSY